MIPDFQDSYLTRTSCQYWDAFESNKHDQFIWNSVVGMFSNMVSIDVDRVNLAYEH